jgi:hypothetical protein
MRGAQQTIVRAFQFWIRSLGTPPRVMAELMALTEFPSPLFAKLKIGIL